MAETERFMTVDSAGRQHVVVVRGSSINTGSLDGPRASIDGLKTLSLLDGSPVKRLQDGTFQVVSTREVLRRV